MAFTHPETENFMQLFN